MILADAAEMIRDLKSQPGTIVQRCFAQAESLGGDECDALRLCVVALAGVASKQNLELHRLALKENHRQG